MKHLLFLTCLFLLIICGSCSEETADCVCTLEFRMYLVTVIDTLGNPVDSLQTKVTNSRGKEFRFDQPSPPFMEGEYYVMTDGYQNEFSIRPEKIIFKGTKNGIEVMGEFYFNTDECRCHVHKVAGPDTLVLK